MYEKKKLMLKAITTEMIHYSIPKGAELNIIGENVLLPYGEFKGVGARGLTLILKKHGGHGEGE